MVQHNKWGTLRTAAWNIFNLSCISFWFWHLNIKKSILFKVALATPGHHLGASLEERAMFFNLIKERKPFSSSFLLRPQNVSGKQKQPGDWNVSDLRPRPSGKEQSEGTRGRCRKLWGAASAAGDLREGRHSEAPVCRTVCYPCRQFCSSSARERVCWNFCF